MSATFEWLVIRCMDGRLNNPIQAFLTEQGITGAYDLLSLPGGPKDLQDSGSGLTQAVEKVSVGLHRVKKVLLIQHTDCGAYGGRVHCGGSEDADHAFQSHELDIAATTLQEAYPELEIVKAMAHILDSGVVEIMRIS
ncbi:hypothetical protein GF380_06175 [Candidatus Uhrbacteria bacterium]|nr:hypothetical protein [Candidatus Uhrbacteria bacterium]MBD3284561.1 hypothetical protein [Candidatus Uhrbacteria bacterium]